ncbi:MAG: mechanosensitive ion channel family protein [Bacteroidales bacterium]|jgi:small conductance mechanosensitive channel|nr:mechanosensitive ion channel family protein [Bacteroidales bacterium]
MNNAINEWTDKLIPWLTDNGVKIIVIGVVAWLLNIILARIVIRTVRIAVVRDNDMSEEAELKRENTLIRIFNGALRIVIIVLAVMMILQEGGIEIGPMLAGAGIVGLAVGFGGQYLIRDIITGLFIILENQYRIGDVVDIDGTGGTVEDISLRLTRLRDLDGTIHHVPHGDIKRVANLSKNFSRINLDIGVSYSSDIEHVIDIINRTGKELAEDPDYKDFFITPPKFLRVNDFADSAIKVKILADTIPLKQWELTGELRKRLKIAFDREGIEIPFPQMVVHKNDEKK